MQGNKENIIVKKSFEFAFKLIDYCERLECKELILIPSKIVGTSKKTLPNFQIKSLSN